MSCPQVATIMSGVRTTTTYNTWGLLCIHYNYLTVPKRELSFCRKSLKSLGLAAILFFAIQVTTMVAFTPTTFADVAPSQPTHSLSTGFPQRNSANVNGESLQTLRNRCGNGLINLCIVAKIESSGRPDAVGDGGKALGLYQLHPLAVKDANRVLKGSYSHQDALRPHIAEKLADAYLNRVIPAYLKHFKKPVTKENVLWAYNAGIGSVVKGKMPQITEAYLAKYRALEASA